MTIIHSAHDNRPTTDIISDLRLGRDMIVREGHHKLNKWLAIEQYMFDAGRRLEILEAELAELLGVAREMSAAMDADVIGPGVTADEAWQAIEGYRLVRERFQAAVRPGGTP